MNTRPLCRYCGKPIPKYTTVISIVDRVMSRADCQKLVAAEIVSLRRRVDGSIDWVGTWDGVTYRGSGKGGALFCTGEHAIRFGKLMAEGGHCTNQYNAERIRRAKAAGKTASDGAPHPKT